MRDPSHEYRPDINRDPDCHPLLVSHRRPPQPHPHPHPSSIPSPVPVRPSQSIRPALRGPNFPTPPRPSPPMPGPLYFLVLLSIRYDPDPPEFSSLARSRASDQVTRRTPGISPLSHVHSGWSSSLRPPLPARCVVASPGRRASGWSVAGGALHPSLHLVFGP